MSLSVSRRAALVSLSSGLLVAGVAFGSAPLSAAPRHPAAPAAAKILDASLSRVAVSPHSSTAWAFGSQSTSTASTYYALRRNSGHWSKQTLKVPAGPVQLFDVASGSPRSAWIVGNSYDKLQTTPLTLIERSTGGGFKPMKTTLGQGQLVAASASSPSNVWAVGGGRTTPGPYIVHWNGKTWKTLSAPKLVGFSFSHVSASGPKNVWFLGSGPTGVVVGIWNGHKLTVKPITLATGHSVTYIATTSPKNTWLVGSVTIAPTTAPHQNTFTEHWNGKKWTAFKAPSPQYNSNAQGVSAVGSNAYLAGYGNSKTGLKSGAYILRYAKGKWKTVLSATSGVVTNLYGISVSTRGGAAVGLTNLRGQCGVAHPTPNEPLAENMVGSSWHKAPAPKFRLGMARVQMTPAIPHIPAC